MERKFITHSQLGIEYGEYLPDYLAELFLHSEHEWLSNAHVMYGPDTGEVWATEIFPKLTEGTLEEHDIEDVANYLPRLVHMLAIIETVEPEYLHLQELAKSILG